MRYHQGVLGLIIPNVLIHSDIEPEQLINLSQAKAWRESLCMHDLKGSVKSTDRFLRSLSQTNIPAPEKLEILNLARPIVGFLCGSIENLNQKDLVNRSPKDKNQVFYINLSLQLELFNQFKFALEQALTNTPLDKAIIAELTFSCLQQSCKILFLCYQNHQVTPQFIWLETHILYAFSQQKDFENKNISIAKHMHSQFACIADIYKHILIFSLANPCNFQQADMLKLYYAIETWAPLLQLHKQTENQTTLFKVDLTQDAPPHSAVLDNKTMQNNGEQNVYSLCFGGILKRINTLLRHCEISSTKQSCTPVLNAHELTLCPNVLSSLLHTWEQHGQRKDIRTLLTGTRTVAVGLKAIHWFATEAQLDVEKQQKTTNATRLKLSEPNQNESIENEDAIEDTIEDTKKTQKTQKTQKT